MSIRRTVWKDVKGKLVGARGVVAKDTGVCERESQRGPRAGIKHRANEIPFAPGGRQISRRYYLERLERS